MKDTLSIKSALKSGYHLLQNRPNPRLETELLLSHVLQVSRAYLVAHQEKLISDEAWETFQSLCQRCRNDEPIAYLLGYKEFWTVDLIVNSNTLIPRPETELLVHETLRNLPQMTTLTIADLGVGSGAVAIALALERPHWIIYGTDLSLPALNVAEQNVTRLGIKNITLLQSDWCQNLPDMRFDAIVSNPPYIAQGDPHLPALKYEPFEALVSGRDGLDAIKIIIEQASCFLKERGLLLLEHGYNQAKTVRALLAEAGFSNIESYEDLSGIQRVTGGLLSLRNKNEKNSISK